MLTMFLHFEIRLLVNSTLRVENKAVCLQRFCVFKIRLYANSASAC